LVSVVQLGVYEMMRDRRRAREEPVDEWLVELDGSVLSLLVARTSPTCSEKRFT
jgi:hypothetical protein